MTEPFNPYSAPTSPIDREIGAWRDGRLLVTTWGNDLPKRCLHCNLPEVAHRWHMFFIWQENLIQRVWMAVPLKVGFCRVHLDRERTLEAWAYRRIGMIVGLLVFGLLAVAVFIRNPFASTVGPADALAAAMSTIIVMIGVYLLLRLLAILVAPSYTSVYRVQGRFVWLAGVDPDYLKELPDWESRQASRIAR